ncbi:MAG TPA: hypothetical protein VFL80_01950, partial [Thermoanaerobaculia bacterium]|nr:hypothetical protein [Thermoanaerobaculia bacterium]
MARGLTITKPTADVKRRTCVRSFALCLLLVSGVASADWPSSMLERAWPVSSEARLADLGRGVAVVFTPDLSVPGNCHFYRALGFACFDDADWTRVLDGIRLHNLANPDSR